MRVASIKPEGVLRCQSMLALPQKKKSHEK
jgi:hypothetical protein